MHEPLSDLKALQKSLPGPPNDYFDPLNLATMTFDWGPQGEEVLPFLRTGPRVESVNDLGSAIGGWDEIGSRYRAEQERLIAHTFALSEVPASQRAADAIAAAIARRNGAL